MLPKPLADVITADDNVEMKSIWGWDDEEETMGQAIFRQANSRTLYVRNWAIPLSRARAQASHFEVGGILPRSFVEIFVEIYISYRFSRWQVVYPISSKLNTVSSNCMLSQGRSRIRSQASVSSIGTRWQIRLTSPLGTQVALCLQIKSGGIKPDFWGCVRCRRLGFPRQFIFG